MVKSSFARESSLFLFVVIKYTPASLQTYKGFNAPVGFITQIVKQEQLPPSQPSRRG